MGKVNHAIITNIPLYDHTIIYPSVYILPLYHYWLQSHLPRSSSSKATVQGLGSWVSRPSISLKDSVFLKCFGYISMLDYLYTVYIIYIFIYIFIFIYIYIYIFFIYIYIYLYLYIYIYIYIYISISWIFFGIFQKYSKLPIRGMILLMWPWIGGCEGTLSLFEDMRPWNRCSTTIVQHGTTRRHSCGPPPEASTASFVQIRNHDVLWILCRIHDDKPSPATENILWH